MLLTALCVKCNEGQRLPRDIVGLYNAIVGLVLHKRYIEDGQCDRPRLLP